MMTYKIQDKSNILDTWKTVDGEQIAGVDRRSLNLLGHDWTVIEFGQRTR